jgi:hypothetical protein
MIGVAFEKLSLSRATVLRLVSAVGSAAVFGLLVAPVIDGRYWPSAFALAFGFGFFFVGGTGYRILIAVALQDASRKASASWSGATAASSLAALAFAVLQIAGGGSGLVVLAGYAAAINTAYIPVKFACLEAGCCHAHKRDRIVIRDRDLRHVEIVFSTAFLAGTLATLWFGLPAVAAVIGIGGHLSVRLLSRWSRRRLPGSGLDEEAKGQELLPLGMLLAVTVFAILAL